MTTYKQLSEAVASLKTVEIKGKDYILVAEKVRGFRMLFPNGSIVTDLLSDHDGRCVFKAMALDEAGNVLGVGHAFETQSGSFINKTSYLENCETSAIGRALAACGIGAGEYASADEVAGAIEMQAWAVQTIKPTNAKYIEHLLEVTESDRDKFLKYFGIEEVDRMVNSDYKKAVEMLEAKMEV